MEHAGFASLHNNDVFEWVSKHGKSLIHRVHRYLEELHLEVKKTMLDIEVEYRFMNAVDK